MKRTGSEGGVRKWARIEDGEQASDGCALRVEYRARAFGEPRDLFFFGSRERELSIKIGLHMVLRKCVDVPFFAEVFVKACEASQFALVTLALAIRPKGRNALALPQTL